MKHTYVRALALAPVLLLLAGAALAQATDSIPAQPTDPTKAAVAAAETWLAVVDSGQYEASWTQAAALFQGAVSQPDWQGALTALRQPLGDVLSRAAFATQYADSLPGAPVGEYVVIQFKTEFANKDAAVETVTPMKDPDGAWRVSGYFIR